jgi:large subunit ribosomal protein L31
MKENIHPKYQKVLFVDSSTGAKLLCGTTLQAKEKETFEGKEYPVVRVSISASSHPFFVGGKQVVDAEGRIDRFTKRYQVAQQKQALEEQKREEQKQEQKQEKKKERVSKTKKEATPKVSAAKKK